MTNHIGKIDLFELLPQYHLVFDSSDYEENQDYLGHLAVDNERTLYGYYDNLESRQRELMGIVSILIDFEKDDTHIYIENIQVGKKHRKKGIAQKLLKHIEESTLNPDSFIYLHVATDNKAAIRLYEKMGYERVALIPHYYEEEKEPAYFYKKSLKG